MQKKISGYEKRQHTKQGVTQDKPSSRQQGRKSSYAHDENTKLVYVVKQKPEMKPTKSTPAQKSMYNLLSGALSGLSDSKRTSQPEESQSEDEDAVKLVERKVSLNRTNVIGLNLEKYNEFKPSKDLSRMI